MSSTRGSLCKRAALAAGGLVVLIGGGHVVAWIAGLMPQGPTTAIIMTTNAGLGLLASGVALILTAAGTRGPRSRRLARVCAAVALLLGLATLSEHLLGWNLRIDQLFAAEFPGAVGVTSPNRMGPPASLSLALLGTALLLLTRRQAADRRRGPALHEPLALVTALLGLLSIIGYLYGVSALYQVARLTGIAWPTALSILLLAVGVLCAEPDHGWMAHVTAPDPGGAIIRGLLGPILLLPLVFGWLRLAGERLGWFDGAMGTSLMMLLFMVTFSSLLVFAGRRVSVASAARGASEREARSQRDLLEESEARLRLAQVAGRVGTFEWNVVSGVNTWSPELEAMYGLAPGGFKRTQRAWEDLLHPDDRAHAVHAVNTAFETGEPGEAEFRVVWPDGSVHWLAGRWQVFRDASGQPLRLTGVNIDVTERKQAEQELRQSERRLALAASATGIGIFVSNSLTGDILATEQFGHLAGLCAAAAATTTLSHHYHKDQWAERVHGDDWPVLRAAIDACQSERRPLDEEYRVAGHDGTERWVNVRGVFEDDDRGNATRFLGVLIDSTDRKKAEADRDADLAALTRMHALSRRGVEAGGSAALLQETIDTAVAIMKADKGTLQLLERDRLRIVAHHGHERPFLDHFAAAENVASVCGEATRRGERVIVPDVETSPIFSGTPSLPVMRAAGVRAVQSTPLLTRGGRLLGILTTQWAAPHTADERSLWRLDLLARQAADLIEQTQADAGLRESNERLRLAQDAGGVGIWEWDVRTNELHWTPELERIYGLEPGSVRAYADFGTRVHPDDLAMVETAWNDAVAARRSFAVEFRIVQPGGNVRWILSKGGAVYDAAAAAARVFGVNIDITERKAADESLRRTEALLTAVSETTEDAIYVKDLDSRLLMVNPATVRLMGKPLEQLIGHTDEEFFDDPAIAHSILEHDRALIRRGQPQVFEETVETPSGHRIMLSSKVPWRDRDGRIMGIIGISRDITERKRAEQALAGSEERYRGIVETAEEGIALHGADGTITYVNERMANMLGYSRGELVGRSSLDFVDDAEREAVIRSREALKDGRGFHAERRLLRKDGSTLWTLSNVTPQRDETGTFVGYLAMHTDISALKETGDALRDVNARLEEADRRKDEFIAILSHELRNPLAPIRFALPVLQKAGVTEAGGEAIEVIARQVTHLTRLVDDLLDVSRITTGKIELRRDYVTLRSVIRSAVEAAAPSVAAGGHSLQLHIPDEPLWVYGDAARLSQIVTNLLDNSAKYTPRGGQLAVTVARQGDQATVSVRDNGVGIPAADLPTVFEMFHQVNRVEKAPGGLGIGLALVKRLVEMHGGAVEAHSAGLGQGAEFVVQLPVAGDVARQAADVVAVSPTRRLRVLVVDDNADLVGMLAVFVESFGHDVRKAFDGPSAVSAAVSYRPDVVLLDIGLPGMTGLDVARELRRRAETSGARLIALTGWGQADDRRATEAAGFDAHLTKPTDPDVLEALLNCERHGCADCVDKCAAAVGLPTPGGAAG
jgi:PAS domain S-box-containing protein